MSRLERVEAAVQVDVVHQKYAAWSCRLPGVLELEEDVSLRMPAVMHEEVDPFKLIEETWRRRLLDP